MSRKNTSVQILEIAVAMFSRGVVEPFDYIEDFVESKEIEYLRVAGLFIEIVEYLEKIGCHVDFSKKKYAEVEKTMICHGLSNDLISFYFDEIYIDVSEMEIDPEAISNEDAEKYGLQGCKAGDDGRS